MLEVSSSKPLASESKGFAFWDELVTLSLPSAGYLSYVVCELLYRSSCNIGEGGIALAEAVQSGRFNT
ncbi:hypothetical protein MTR67_026046 [Solanum verrucosum]|uniref:Uncharacterized protein n=1 Tax=Solanum verrucosum TaxID=315347 RepID=A0AAF0TU34_SOLVR|nr:hypothetical protein MTR67_026046 [Solanum verrucosum]